MTTDILRVAVYMIRHVTCRIVAVVTLMVGVALLWRQIVTARRGSDASRWGEGTHGRDALIRIRVFNGRDAPIHAIVSTPTTQVSWGEFNLPHVVNSTDLHVPPRSRPGIPCIVHQTWSGEEIPSQFTPWVRSWMEQNPSWQYWFWTDDDIRCFVEHHFPQYLDLYDDYEYNINRADVMRY